MEENIISKYEPLIYKIARKFYNVEICDLYPLPATPIAETS